MTDQEIIIEVAKLDGWEFKYRPTETYPYKAIRDDEIFWCWEEHLDYLTSRDAIIPVIVNMYNGKNKECIQSFEKILLQEQGIVSSDIKLMRGLYSTPRQLCIALLKATGRWKE